MLTVVVNLDDAALVSAATDYMSVGLLDVVAAGVYVTTDDAVADALADAGAEVL